jgi:CyaY protein
MASDIDFQREADQFMERVLGWLEEFDPDEIDADLAMGVLTMEFGDGSKCIMNRQTAARQVWLAAGASAWHFERSPEQMAWLDTKGGRRLESVLAEVLSAKLGRPVQLGNVGA